MVRARIKAVVAQDEFMEHAGYKILKWSKEGHFYIGLAIDPKDEQRVTALYISNGETMETKLVRQFKPGETSLPGLDFSVSTRKQAEEYLFWTLLLRYWDLLLEMNHVTKGKGAQWAPATVKSQGARGW